MPRIETKRKGRYNIWGTGALGRRGDKSLERIERSDKWRKDRNQRKKIRKSQ